MLSVPVNVVLISLMPGLCALNMCDCASTSVVTSQQGPNKRIMCRNKIHQNVGLGRGGNRAPEGEVLNYWLCSTPRSCRTRSGREFPGLREMVRFHVEDKRGSVAETSLAEACSMRESRHRDRHKTTTQETTTQRPYAWHSNSSHPSHCSSTPGLVQRHITAQGGGWESSNVSKHTTNNPKTRENWP